MDRSYGARSDRRSRIENRERERVRRELFDRLFPRDWREEGMTRLVDQSDISWRNVIFWGRLAACLSRNLENDRRGLRRCDNEHACFIIGLDREGGWE